MATTLVDLLVPRTAEQRLEQLLAYLNVDAFPVTDWFVGSAGRTMAKAIATALGSFDSLLPQIASGGFVGPLVINGQTLPTRGWLELLARQIYDLEPGAPTYAKQRIALWCSAGSGPYVISVGQLTAKSADDRRYTNTEGGTVPAGTNPIVKIHLAFQAETPGEAYNGDTAGRITQLVTPLPGLQISNEPANFGGVDSLNRLLRNGTGTGTVTAQLTGTSPPTGSRLFTLRITGAGDVAAAAAGELTATGVVTTVTPIARVVTTVTPIAPLPATLAIGGGITLAFANGGQTPSFLIGDVYTFQTPGSPLTNPGTDAEPSSILQARMRGRWPSLSAVPTEDRHIGWARQISSEQGFGIVKITAKPSVMIAGQVEIRLATSAGGVSSDVRDAVQDYIDAREGIGDLAQVLSATPLLITAGGTVVVRSSRAAAVKARAKANWEAYVAELPIGGDPPHSVVRVSELQQAIMDAGAVDAGVLTLNGSALNTQLADDQVATVGNSIDTALTWIEVP